MSTDPNALSKKPLKEQLSIRKYRQCVAMAQQEALELLDCAQIKPAKLTVVPTHLIPKLLSLPNPLFKFSVHDKFHRTLILSGFCLLKIAKISLNSSFFPKPIKR